MNMSRLALSRALAVGLCGFGITATALAQTASDQLSVKVIAEVETHTTEHGRPVTRLVAADRVVPGDFVFYTLEVRNQGGKAVDSPTVVEPIPAHTVYLTNSAVGPAIDVSYSVDNASTFDLPENLRVPGPGNTPRPAVAADYTHIRWRLKASLKANSVALLRFRAQVK